MRTSSSWDSGRARRAVAAGIDDGVQAWADAVETGSNRRVPKLTDRLERSSSVTSAATAHGREAAISYSDPAAVPQHERLDYHHSNGQAKFLEQALTHDGRDAVDRVAAAIRARLGG